jgi:hypothetical protein
MIFWSDIGVNICANDQPVGCTDSITYIYLLHEKWYKLLENTERLKEEHDR